MRAYPEADCHSFSGIRGEVRDRTPVSTLAQASLGDDEQPIDAALEDIMLHWAIALFVIALIAAFLGFGGIAASAAGIAKILFFVFVVLFVLSLIFGGFRRGRPL